MIYLFFIIFAGLVPPSNGRTDVIYGELDGKYWVEPMREVHSRFTGQKGTLAHFGDSITVTMAFWSPLQYIRKNAPPEMEKAFEQVNDYMLSQCWSNWKGAEFGSDGSQTIRWAYDNVDEWLKKLNPESALIMFGSNDLHQLELDEYIAKTKAVVKKCLDNGTVVILNTIPPINGYTKKALLFAEAVRQIALEFKVPLVDYYDEIIKRRPEDWDGSMEKFKEFDGYDVPTLISRDGVHPSHPVKYRDDYSDEALRSNGYSLRNYLVLLKYAEVIGDVFMSIDSLLYQSWFPKAPQLPPPDGEVIRVTSIDQLFDAVERVKPGGTILIADGHYMMPRYLEIHTDNVTMRSESGLREKVILDGAESQHGELVGVRRCSGVTFADLTIQNIKHNGFKINSDSNVQKVTIYNCVIHNIWERGVKGVKVPEENREQTRPKGCRVQYCLFYNDRPKEYSDDPADNPNTFDGNYIGGIDTMFAKDWLISDNVFIGIQGRTHTARGAIFIWHDSQDCIIERNIIIDCDTGIALGNSHKPEDIAIHCTGLIVRNNFVTRTPENGIVADYTKNCKILHNTIHHPNNQLKRLIRLVHDNDGLVVANNLLSGPPMRIETDSKVEIIDNYTKDMTASFVNPENGNLHLKGETTELRVAKHLSEVLYDVDNQSRSSPTDFGADER
ncbi:MAG: hypothetical protein QG641_696 [Candidatus Poribacteria bacterium]|nr:hypothetical protein [Candidatus Poribacteria bacterium]